MKTNGTNNSLYSFASLCLSDKNFSRVLLPYYNFIFEGVGGAQEAGFAPRTCNDLQAERHRFPTFALSKATWYGDGRQAGKVEGGSEAR
jgi:hypothetical protein